MNKILIIFFSIFTTTVFSQDNYLDEANCKSLIVNFDSFSEEQQVKVASICREEYVEKLKLAIKSVKKSQNSACHYLDLQAEVKMFHEYVLDRVPTKKISRDKMEDMKDFYFELYGDGHRGSECSPENTAQLFFGAYIMENIEVVDEITDQV